MPARIINLPEIRSTVAPPQVSEEEMREAEAVATFTVKQFLATSAILYICTYRGAERFPHAAATDGTRLRQTADPMNSSFRH